MRIGPYEVVKELGRGGMGAVYLARTAGGEERAVKLIGPLESAEALGRFDRERGLLAALGEKDGVLSLLDWGMAEGLPYLVMPVARGGSLARALASPMVAACVRDREAVRG